MAYGFKLGQIEGLDSSISNITLTLTKDAVSNSYNLTYIESERGWVYNLDDVAFYLSIRGEDGAFLAVGAFDGGDVGDEYAISITKTEPTEEFVKAVNMVSNANSNILHINGRLGNMAVEESYKNVLSITENFGKMPIYVIVNGDQMGILERYLWGDGGFVIRTIDVNPAGVLLVTEYIIGINYEMQTISVTDHSHMYNPATP